MKKTLLRKAIYNVGAEAFPEPSAFKEPEKIEVDGEAVDNHMGC